MLNAVNILVNNIWLIMINDVYQLSIAADQEMKKSEAILITLSMEEYLRRKLKLLYLTF